MVLPFFITPTVRLAVNMLATFAYWHFQGFCCCDWQSAGLSRRATAWLFIAASVVFLSQKDLVPSFVDVYENVRPVFNVCAVVLCVHMLYCFLWIELLAVISMALCLLDRIFNKIGLGVLLDNLLITLRRHGGYINLYTFLALVLLVLAIFSWFKMILELEEFNRWASCDLQRTGRHIERQLNQVFEESCQESCSSNNNDNINENSNESPNPHRRTTRRSIF